jgi:hypothetical protein
MSARRFVMVMCLALSCVANSAWAARYDLDLGGYFPTNNTVIVSSAQTQFEDLVTELGQITAPVFLSPAKTLGHNGFAVGLGASVAPISGQRSFWRDATTQGTPGSAMFVPHLAIRKGLPFSFEVGSQFTYLPDSEMFALGGEVKWAINEGFHYLPDVAIRVSINHLLGAKDFELTSGGWDVSVSKAFGVGGMMSLTPFGGYNMLFIHAASHVIVPHGIAIEKLNGARKYTVVFDQVNWQDNVHHRFFCGVLLKTVIFQIVAEGVFTSKGINLFRFMLGFDY